ncbi:deoC [Cordylochernes scorpioides]|uniref:DeoC n=1 Tax=Cordylochernes scorpioides TaxID=51811 RepID=A0ABY6LVH1_9ARAC|nr:deoC [Cordylochernes scorpioides]
MENCKTKSPPLDVNIDFSQYENSKKCDPKKYQEILGNLLFLSVKTRPDPSFPLIQLSKYSQDPREIHFNALKGIFGYLKKLLTLLYVTIKVIPNLLDFLMLVGEMVAWILNGIKCIDLTTLSGDDTRANVRQLCYKALNPIAPTLLKQLGLSYSAVQESYIKKDDKHTAFADDYQFEDPEFISDESGISHLFVQATLNGLVRDLGLSKEAAEILKSRLKQRNLLLPQTKISVYRNGEQ